MPPEARLAEVVGGDAFLTGRDQSSPFCTASSTFASLTALWRAVQVVQVGSLTEGHLLQMSFRLSVIVEKLTAEDC